MGQVKEKQVEIMEEDRVYLESIEKALYDEERLKALSEEEKK